MYMILQWVDDDYLTCFFNVDNSIKLFETLKEADKFADKHPDRDNLRVITIEGVNE